MKNFSLLTFAFLLLLSAAGAQEKRINGWEISQESYNKEKIDQLRNKILDRAYKEINSLIVVKNGRLLIEEYFNGAGRNTTHDTRSVGKTFASAVTGIALHEGYLKSIDQTLSEFYDLKKYENFNEKKTKVILKHLLTMSSGFDGFDFDEKSIGNEENMYPQPDWVYGKPYEVYYCSGDGGNKIFMFTEYPIVVVVTASAYNKRYAHPQIDEMMLSYIIPAVN